MAESAKCRILDLRESMAPWQIVREMGFSASYVRKVIRAARDAGTTFPAHPRKPTIRVNSKRYITVNQTLTLDQRRAIRTHYFSSGSIEATAKAKGLSYRVVHREVEDMIRRPSKPPQVDAETILAAYAARPNLNLVSRQLKLPYSRVSEVVEKELGADRWKGDSKLRQKRQSARSKSEDEMGPRVDAATMTRETPDSLCETHLGSRFYKNDKGAYWLDGKLCSIGERMREVNRVMKAKGLPPLPVPEWQ